MAAPTGEATSRIRSPPGFVTRAISASSRAPSLAENPSRFPSATVARKAPSRNGRCSPAARTLRRRARPRRSDLRRSNARSIGRLKSTATTVPFEERIVGVNRPGPGPSSSTQPRPFPRWSRTNRSRSSRASTRQASPEYRCHSRPTRTSNACRSRRRRSAAAPARRRPELPTRSRPRFMVAASGPAG